MDIVMSNVTDGSTTREHQVTMLEEIAKLIRPEGFTEQQVGSFLSAGPFRLWQVDLAPAGG